MADGHRTVPNRMIDIHQIGPDRWRLWRSLRLAALSDAADAFGARLSDWQDGNDTEQRWRDRLRDVEANYVAYVDDHPVGMVSGQPSDDGSAVELISLWVDPPARGRGVADALIGAVLDWANTHILIKRATARVRRTNRYARTLFARNAFHAAGAATPDDAVEFLRPLGRRRRVGLHSGQQYQDFASLRSVFSRAESLGYDWISIFDHYRPPILGPAGPCLDGPTSLSALAATIPRVRCGMLVAAPSWRHPALTAVIAATIDHVSGGRLEFGLGRGGADLAFGQYGIPAPQPGDRTGRLEETCQILRLLWQGGPVDFSGTHFHLRAAYLNPRPVQHRLPLIIGGLSEQHTLPVAAKFADIWNTIVLPAATYRDKSQRLDAMCLQHGRDPAAIRRSLTFRAVIRDGNTISSSAIPHAADRRECLSVGGAQQLVDRLGRYADIGVEDFVLAARPPVDFETVERFAQEVAPILRTSGSPA